MGGGVDVRRDGKEMTIRGGAAFKRDRADPENRDRGDRADNADISRILSEPIGCNGAAAALADLV